MGRRAVVILNEGVEAERFRADQPLVQVTYVTPTLSDPTDNSHFLLIASQITVN